ncbi:MAG TPA: hypothetical protein VF665_16480 [Longimicrobium sp.]|jgi:hypothetical protein|uniref:hypothetical protein n=1 Tax=Longimicrobium sp. TaxID=2029185 RepID=UPI002ED7D3AB
MARRTNRTASVKWLAAVLLALASCDLRDPTAPPVSAEPQLDGPSRDAGSTVLGSYAAPTPMANPGKITTYQEPAAAPIPLAPYSYTLLRITGTMEVQKNPFIYGVKPGEGLASYSAVRSRVSTSGGATRVWIRWSGQAYPTTEVSGFQAAEDGRDVMVLVRTQGTAGEVWVGRNGMSNTRMFTGFCIADHPYCSASDVQPKDWYPITIEDFWISQSHTVTGTQVMEPLRIEGPAAVATGTPGTFRAATWGGLRFRNAMGNREAFRWNFYPGDTTATPNPVESQTLPCGDTIACTFVPLRSGRLRLYTHVEGASVEARDFIVKVREPEVVVQCPAKVPSGVTATCTARLEPATSATSFVVQNWSFSGSAQPASQSGDLKQWQFKPAETGTAAVEALVGGITKQGRVRIEVACNFLAGETDDPFLNDAAFQANFRQLWANSNADDPGPGRVEQGSLVLSKDENYTFVPYDGPSTRCSSVTSVKIPAGYRLVAFIHTHPDNGGTPIPPDGSCPDVEENGHEAQDGPSRRDRQTARTLRRVLERYIPGYIVDPDNVYRFGHRSLRSRRFNRDQTCWRP